MATGCRQIRHYRKAGRGEAVQFPTWATLVVGRGLVFPPACEEPSLLKASERPIQSAMGCETTGALLIPDLLRDPETMKFLTASRPQIQCGNKNRLFDWNECAWLASHNLIIPDICALKDPCERCDGVAHDLNRRFAMPVTPAHRSETIRQAFTQANLSRLCRVCRRCNIRLDRFLESYLWDCSMDWRGALVSQVPARPAMSSGPLNA